MPELLIAVFRFLLIIPAIILHEIAHGYVAYLLGDPTAKMRGRLTLNPLAHIDPWGTVLLPGMMLLVSNGSLAFGYAKPVPIDPYRMRRTSVQTGMLLTGAAGPVTNILLAVATAMVYRVSAGFGAPSVLLRILDFFVLINLVLAFLNLIPIPPLDGSRIVQRFLKGSALNAYQSIEPWGFGILLIILFVLPGFANIDVIGPYFEATVLPIYRLLMGV